MNDSIRVSQSGHTRPQTEVLICDGLSFCCPYAFFLANRNTPTNLIATRLGVSSRTIRVWKTKFREKDLCCANQSKCLKYKLKELRHARKINPA